MVQLFETNGLRVAKYYDTSLMAWDRMTGAPDPAARMNTFDLLCGAEQDYKFGNTFLDEASHLDHITAVRPDVLLVVIEHTDFETTLTRALGRHDGLYALRQASWRGVDVDDLPDLLREEYATLKEAIEGAEAAGIRVIRLNEADGVAGWAEALAPWFDLPKLPNLKPHPTVRLDRNRWSKLHELTPEDVRLTDEMAQFCLGPEAEVAADATPPVHSGLLADWDGDSRLTLADGTDYPALFGRFNGRWAFLATSKSQKAYRASCVVNEAMLTPYRVPLRIDMEDARLYGSEGRGNPAQPVISQVRRAEARNAILWPLAQYHTVGAYEFVVPGFQDQTPFDDKPDVLFWRGALSGHCSDTAAGQFSHPIYDVIRNLEKQPDNEKLWDLLGKNIRYATVARMYGKPGVDMALSNSPYVAFLRSQPRAAHLCGSTVPISTMRAHRYILSMRGYDTGSNFISALNSTSVVLKEEDGWQSFYTPLFKPWEHYIPVKAGLVDLEEQLEWARANTDRCKEISAAARDRCRLLGNLGSRRRLLNGIMQGLAERAERRKTTATAGFPAG